MGAGELGAATWGGACSRAGFPGKPCESPSPSPTRSLLLPPGPYCNLDYACPCNYNYCLNSSRSLQQVFTLIVSVDPPSEVKPQGAVPPLFAVLFLCHPLQGHWWETMASGCSVAPGWPTETPWAVVFQWGEGSLC